ncbi:MAG TPA: VOC family protein [Thermoanaerobaculaceae bacterium]|nr:VOC family protein [Thermoanaerobaculaceae bacterium]
MPKNPPEDTPRIAAYLYYEDVDAALRWLSQAFGLRESMRMAGPDGKVAHAEMRLADGLVMMGRPGPQYRNPKHVGSVTQSLHVYVDDVDAHFARAKAAGAKIIAPPEDQFYGDRRYAAEDPEGHHWYFAQHVRDVSDGEMKAHLKG